MSTSQQVMTFADTDLAWAAGIVDGEGSICLIQMKRYKPGGSGLTWDLRLDVGNTDPRMLLRLRRIFGNGGITTNTPKPRRMPSWTIHWHGAKAARILELIRPHLTIKCEQADVALLSRAFVRQGRPDLFKERGMREAAERLKALHTIRPNMEEAERVIH